MKIGPNPGKTGLPARPQQSSSPLLLTRNGCETLRTASLGGKIPLLSRRGAAGSVYVSRFTFRASSRSLEDVVVESGHLIDGEAATAVLYRLAQPRQSNAATADKIKADFSDLNGWATGLSVQEIIPVSGDEWVASIGLIQNVVHRVLVKADGSSCLANATGETIRGTDATARATPRREPPRKPHPRRPRTWEH